MKPTNVEQEILETKKIMEEIQEVNEIMDQIKKINKTVEYVDENFIMRGEEIIDRKNCGIFTLPSTKEVLRSIRQD